MGLSALLSAGLDKINEFLHAAEPLTAFLGYRLVELSEGVRVRSLACRLKDDEKRRA